MRRRCVMGSAPHTHTKSSTCPPILIPNGPPSEKYRERVRDSATRAKDKGTPRRNPWRKCFARRWWLRVTVARKVKGRGLVEAYVDARTRGPCWGRGWFCGSCYARNWAHSLDSTCCGMKCLCRTGKFLSDCFYKASVP